MKVLFSLSIVLAISGGFVSSQVTTAEFEVRVQDLRARFHELHREMDYYLRDSRWNVSTLIRDWNTNLLSQHALFTTQVQNDRYEVYNQILERAAEIGNQNECLISLDGRLVAASITASEQAKQCAQSAYEFTSAAIRDNYFDLINLIQRESTTAQHVQFYGMGAYNVITNQQGVLNFLDGVWEEVEHGWPNIWSVWVDEEESKLAQYRTVGTTLSSSCLDSALNNYSGVLSAIRGEIAGCA